LERSEYDTIYHEHLCYFTVTTLERLTRSAGLHIVQVDRVSVHGGSLRVEARRAEGEARPSQVVERWMADEAQAGLQDRERYRAFASAVERNRERLVDLISRLVGAGSRVAAYGAAAKGNTLLNYCGIDATQVSFVVDRSPLKIGLLTPGMHLPVRPVSALEEDPPDYVLLLAWNLADEIMSQQAAFQRGGGRFVIPIPEPRMA
jgi:hypothetical protein